MYGFGKKPGGGDVDSVDGANQISGSVAAEEKYLGKRDHERSRERRKESKRAKGASREEDDNNVLRDEKRHI